MPPQRVALIPARGGSKRIPRKNIRDFLGTPILERVVQAVLASETVDRVIVSTDDQEIAEVARASGAEAPFRRPDALSDAYTGARPVIQHAIRQLALEQQDLLGVVYPTAVFATPVDLRNSLDLFEENKSQFLISVTEMPAPIERTLRLNDQGRVSPVSAEGIQMRSQDLPNGYYDTGQFYWGACKSWCGDSPVVKADSVGYVLPSWRVVDIDTPADWTRAELLYRALHDLK